MGVSLKPSDATKGGGLHDDFDALFQETKFVMWDYNGKVPVAVPAIYSKLKDVDTDEDFDCYWSMGSAKDWMPNPDGKSLMAVATATTLNDNTNGIIMLTSLVNCGFPEDKLDDDITVLDGMVAHIQRVAAPERKGLKKDKEKAYEDQISIVSEIKKFPWDKAASKNDPKTQKASGSGGKKTTAKAEAAPAEETGGGDIEAKAAKVVMQALAERGGTVPKLDLPTIVFQTLSGDDPDMPAVMQRIYEDTFLGAEGKPWKYENEMVSL